MTKFRSILLSGHTCFIMNFDTSLIFCNWNFLYFLKKKNVCNWLQLIVPLSHPLALLATSHQITRKVHGSSIAFKMDSARGGMKVYEKIHLIEQIDICCSHVSRPRIVSLWEISGSTETEERRDKWNAVRFV